MKFDWYEATVDAKAEDVTRTLLLQGQGLAEVRPHRGTTYGYERAYDVAIGPRVLATMFYGGTAQGVGVHVTATGSEALWFAPVCRKEFEHEVTRLDVAEDFHGPQAWPSLCELLERLAKDRGLSTNNAGDWTQAKTGRTLYVGSPMSSVRVRLYEKGKEYAARGIKDVPHDWVRLEGVFRPRKQPARRFLAAAQPFECFGLSNWSAELYKLLTDCEVERIEDVKWSATDDERAWTWLVRQYGPLLVRKMQAVGSWEGVGALLGEAISNGSGRPSRGEPRGAG